MFFFFNYQNKISHKALGVRLCQRVKRIFQKVSLCPACCIEILKVANGTGLQDCHGVNCGSHRGSHQHPDTGQTTCARDQLQPHFWVFSTAKLRLAEMKGRVIQGMSFMKRNVYIYICLQVSVTTQLFISINLCFISLSKYDMST